MCPDAPLFHNKSLMNIGIVVPEPSGISLVIQYIQELYWLAVPRPDQLKQPQIITLPFADLNRNDFFLARQCIFTSIYMQNKF